MNKKEFILDSLINDDEARTQIIEYYEYPYSLTQKGKQAWKEINE